MHRKGGNTKKFGFDYGISKVTEQDEPDEFDNEKESQLLKEVDILNYVDDLTDKDKQLLNDMSCKYGIKSYARLLRVAKKDRDDELRALQRQQKDGKPKGEKSRNRGNERRRRRRRDRRGRSNDQEERYRRRHSPSYEAYGSNSNSENGSTEDEEEDEDYDGRPTNSSSRGGQDSSDFVIEFGSGAGTKEENIEREREENEKSSRSQRYYSLSLICLYIILRNVSILDLQLLQHQ